MITNNFTDALEIASKDLPLGYSKDEKFLLELMAQISGVEIPDNFKKNIEFFMRNFAVEDGKLLYTEDGVKKLKEALKWELEFYQEMDRINNPI